MPEEHQVIICGAGIMGVSAAHYLAAAGIHDVLLVDERPPLTLTSDRSTECYRNWWPDPELVALMNRSIDLMEGLAAANGNVFHINRRGYLYVTANPQTLPDLVEQSGRISLCGAGPLRIHETSDSAYEPIAAGLDAHPAGADLVLAQGLLRRHFPYLADTAVAALHVRRAGWLSAQQLGMFLLEEACRRGAQRRVGRVAEVRIAGGRVRGITLDNAERLDCKFLVDAAGPSFKSVGEMMGLSLPVETELHMKVAFEDVRGVVDRGAPLLVWNDTQFLPWADEEIAALAEEPENNWLTGPLRGGAHARPEGGSDSRTILMLWDYRPRVMDPSFPIALDEQYPEVVLRGLSTMLPGLRSYFGRSPRPRVDGGYYVKTPENRPLIGPCDIEGAYLMGAVSGYGIMSACAAGELLAAHIQRKDLPRYASAFSLGRYRNPAYAEEIAQLSARGEL